MESVRNEGSLLYGIDDAAVKIKDIAGQLLRVVVVELDDDILADMCRIRICLDDVRTSSWTQFSSNTDAIGPDAG